MNKLIHHIDFLLHNHSRVIVPGFGTFVLNYVPASNIGISEYTKPAYELSFNEELNDNDSILVESYMKYENLLLRDAFVKIENTVEDIKQKLERENYLKFGKLGGFSLNDENLLVFTPGKFVHPELFGLNDVCLKTIPQTNTETVSEKSRKSHKGVIGKIVVSAAVAAAAALFILISVDMLPLQKQSVNILSNHKLKNLFTGKSNDKNPAKASTTENKTPEIVAPIAEKIPETVESITAKERFYVVTGVYKEIENAQNLLNAIKADGFNNAAILNRGDRLDVYIEVFNTPDEANEFTQKIHKEFSEYKRAWVLKYKK